MSLTVPHTADFAGLARDPQTSGVAPGPSGVPTVVAATVSQFPGVAVGAALAAGVMLGWFVKRM